MAAFTAFRTAAASFPSWAFTWTSTVTSWVVGAMARALTAISRRLWRAWLTWSSRDWAGTPDGEATTTSTVPRPRFLGRTRTAATPSTARATWA